LTDELYLVKLEEQFAEILNPEPFLSIPKVSILPPQVVEYSEAKKIIFKISSKLFSNNF